MNQQIANVAKHHELRTQINIYDMFNKYNNYSLFIIAIIYNILIIIYCVNLTITIFETSLVIFYELISVLRHFVFIYRKHYKMTSELITNEVKYCNYLLNIISLVLSLILIDILLNNENKLILLAMTIHLMLNLTIKFIINYCYCKTYIKPMTTSEVRIYENMNLSKSNWTVKSSYTKCYICQNAYNKKSTLKIFSCGHSTHTICSEGLISRNNYCSVCSDGLITSVVV